MHVRFWGVRGSIPVPGPRTVRYGGNTSCVEVRADDGTVIVLDCGSGARELGLSLLGDDRPPDGAPRAVLIGHTHWDHIHGLPFFRPLFAPGEWAIYGPRGIGKSLADTLSGQMEYTYFPVRVDDLIADVEYHDLVEGVFEIGDVVVHTQYLNHPALTLGYRIEVDGRAIAYAVDHEPFDRALGLGGDPMSSVADARHVEFLADADVVIHDSQYLASEYHQKVGWGHSTIEYAVDVAIAAECRQLVLTHHEPTRDDDAIDVVLADARHRAERGGLRGRVDAAAEGWTIELARRGARAVSPPAGRPALLTDATHDLADDALLAVADPAVRGVVSAAVTAEHLAVHGDLAPDEVLGGRTVVFAEAGDDESALTAVLEQCSPDTAVLGLTRVLPAPAAKVVDWIVWPSTVAHVRTKLRAALLRQACRWTVAPLPADEASRLESLRALGVLDTAPEARFDRFTHEACEVLGVPVALVSLVDEDRQWFKSKAGIDATETPRDLAVCAHAILGPDVFLVPDLLADPRFADNPAVQASDPRLRSYAGVPLQLADGSRVGTFCVLDHRPRDFDDAQLDALRRLAGGVLAELEAPSI